jgi:hypothetical protein
MPVTTAAVRKVTAPPPPPPNPATPNPAPAGKQAKPPASSQVSSQQEARADRSPLVFISAKSEDYQHARQVYEFLVSQGVNVFMSEESLPKVANADYREVIDEALDRAHHMVVVTSSQHNVEAPWVKHEWGFFVNAKRSGHKSGNIMTLLVGDMTAADLPPGLRYLEALPCRPDSLGRMLMYMRNV